LLQKLIIKFLSISLITLGLISFLQCKNKEQPILPVENIPSKTYKNIYAKGFEITGHEFYKVLTVKSPWPNAKQSYSYILVNENNLERLSIPKNEYEGVITIPLQKIVVTSTTHIPALELLQVEESLVGFPGLDYISSEKTRKRIDSGNIRELGKNENINTEVILTLSPNVVIGFGIEGKNKNFETIKNSNIPIVYNGDWVESSPLAKAEWIKFFGVLYNKEKEADSIFNSIEANYLNAKSLAKKVKNKPTILSGAMHNDIWYLPNGESTEAQLLKDANTNYLFKEQQGTGSLSLNFETVFTKAQNADIWLSPSNYNSLQSLENSNSHYTKFKAFQNKKVYSFTNTIGKTGGVIYFELGLTRPDLVLKDLIKICHPELLEDYELYFFKKLD
jgi:iron complex transport system substrate-binding protein